MTDKKILTILLLLAFYIFVVSPLNSSLKMELFELRHLEKAIAKEKFIAKKSEEIKKLYPDAIKKIKKNNSLFFKGSLSNSSAMSSLQNMIKNSAGISGVQVVNMTWGVAVDKKGYTTLPISFLVRGYPNSVFSFVKNMLSLKKFLIFSMFSTSRFRDKLVLRAVVVGFKIKEEKAKQ